MRIAVTGASGVFGRGIAARLRAQGHDVVGLARHRPENWFHDADFVTADVRDPAGVRHAVEGADVVAHCAWVVNSIPDETLTRDINLSGTRNVLDAMSAAGTPRIVFASSVLSYGAREKGAAPVTETDALRPSPEHLYGFHKAEAEAMLRNSGHDWVALRCAVVVGRDVDNTVMRLLASPVFPNVDGSADRSLQVVHTDDVHRLFVAAVLGRQTGALNVAAPGQPTFREITAALGRRMVPVRRSILDAGLGALYRRELVEASPAELALLLNFPVMDTSRLRDDWGYTPAWSAAECLADFALGVRGRVALGKKVFTMPWRVGLVTDVPPVDEPAADGRALQWAGPQGHNGEFDTPIDPRFPTFVATNLSEALPGPFTPSSSSVTVRGFRAGGVSIAERLRLRGVIRREVATRAIGIFSHRLYAGVSSVYYMARAMPGTDPDSMIGQFFGRAIGDTPVFGDERPPVEPVKLLQRVADLAVLGVTGVGLIAGSAKEARDYVADVERLERLADTPGELTDVRLESLILLARDLVVQGWVLASWAGMFCTVTATALQRLTGEATMPSAGPELASARTLTTLHRLVAAARTDPAAVDVLTHAANPVAALRDRAPAFHQLLTESLAAVGHRGPAECEMRASVYADDPNQLASMVAKSLAVDIDRAAAVPPLGWRARPVERLAARQVRGREVVRDKVVRGTWLLRGLVRELSRRLIERGVLTEPDDVFFLTIDELAALPPDPAAVVRRRRDELVALSAVRLPSTVHGSWQPQAGEPALSAGQTMRGLGVCGGLARGRVRIVDENTIDDLQAGEVLVAAVTDVGYTPAFAYAAAVVTNLGGPLSHAAVVAREFGVTCVVDATGATRRLRDGALVEVDGRTGTITIVDDGAVPVLTRSSEKEIHQ